MSTTTDATVGILGAGVSGILMGMQLRRAGFDDFVIYDKESDVGGTWYRNTYPGLCCDIPSHLYSYSFEPNPDWSATYADRAEIQRYIRACAEKYDLVAHLRTDTMIDTATYDDGDGVWTVETAAGCSHRHRVLVAATGGLVEPRLPRIPGYDSFEGLWWHSASWRHDVDLTGLRVAVVGSAASAVQVVPAVAEHAADVYVYSRSPNWVMPRRNHAYTDSERDAFRAGDELRRLRRRQYKESLLQFRAVNRDADAIDELRRRGLEHLHASIDDPALRAQLTPDYDPGCNRILVSDDYYSTLALEHVHLVPRGVDSLTATGVLDTDRVHTEVDVVIFCTGYSAGNKGRGRAAVDVFGRNGEVLTEILADSPEVYRGVAIPGFPNYFTVCGVNGVVSYTSYFMTAELETEYIARWVQRLVEEGLHSVEADAEATSRFSSDIQAELQQMSWTGGCSNFYTDRTGRVLAFFPGTVGRMRRELRDLHDEDFRVRTG